MKVAAALEHAQRVFLDTAPAIYFLEGHPAYSAVMEAFFRVRREKQIVLVTSPITLAECLVHPIRRDLRDLVEGYRRLILTGAGTEFHAVGPDAAEYAARLRATRSVPLIDAIQVGVAVCAGCQSFLTNDKRLSKIGEIPILVLDELEK